MSATQRGSASKLLLHGAGCTPACPPAPCIPSPHAHLQRGCQLLLPLRQLLFQPRLHIVRSLLHFCHLHTDRQHTSSTLEGGPVRMARRFQSGSANIMSRHQRQPRAVKPSATRRHSPTSTADNQP